jgi:hypothetical protein
MQVIRPTALTPSERRRARLLAGGMLATGLTAAALAAVGAGPAIGTGIFAAVAAVALGVGAAWLLRSARPNRSRDLGHALVERLSPAFDDSYTLVVAPRLPLRDASRLDGILVGPGGIRVVTARSWEGRYRVRGKVWEFDAGRRGWIRCRTNPSYEAVALADGFARWLADRGFGELPIRPVIAFPLRHSRLVLEEPADEILTSDNAPWWANSIGRVRRIDPAQAGQVLDAVLDASEADDGAERRASTSPVA